MMRRSASGPSGGAAPSDEQIDASVDKDGRPWRIRNWPLRRKLIAVLLVPLIAAVAFGGFRVAGEIGNAQQLDSVTKQVELSQRSSEVVFQLQREREVVGAWVQDGRSPAGRQAVDAQVAATDAAINSFRSGADVDSLSPQMKGLYDQALDRTGSVRVIREVATNSRFSPTSTVRAYEDVIGMLLQLERTSSQGLSDPSLSAAANSVDALARAKEYAGQQNTLMRIAARANTFPYSDLDTMREAEARYTASVNQYQTQAPTEQVQQFSNTVAGSDVDERQRLQQIALIRGGNGERLQVPEQTVDQVSEATLNKLRQTESGVQDQVLRTANSAAKSAWINAVRDTGLIVVVLGLAVAITVVVARSLTRPLNRLRRSAEDVAANRLPAAVEQLQHAKNESSLGQLRPEQVQVFTNEEIGEVARSFDEVHSQALRLASEQALLRNNINDLFVNLARRSQTLVQRQLSLIDRLEQDEQDPDQLSSLFELDHLATRMRRNSENLLILGGTDLTRRMMRPVPLSEVIGAAVSEVEQYARIAVPDPPDLAVQGRVVNDFVHLIAELLENATVFSNPDTEVSVRTAYRRQTLVVEIRDRGVGIDNAELAEINDRLVRLPDVDVAVSRRMGLYVVGQLARRHGIGVELRNNTDLEGGVTATVQVSGELIAQLTEDGPKPMPDIQTHAEQRGEEQRDPLTESGAHHGLAAAFGRAGFTDRAAEPATERSVLNGDLSGEAATRGVSAEQAGAVESSSPQLGSPQFGSPQLGSPEGGSADQISPATGSGSPRSDYSALPASDEGAGPADVPNWQEDVAESGIRFGQEPTEHVDRGWLESRPWPAEQQPWPGADGGAEPEPDLFHSPFEAEKTSEFASAAPAWPPENDGVDQADTSAGDEREDDDAPTERLPIYEAVLSQWFRESDADVPTRGSGSRSAMSSDLGSSADSGRISSPADFREFSQNGADTTTGAAPAAATSAGVDDGADIGEVGSDDLDDVNFDGTDLDGVRLDEANGSGINGARSDGDLDDAGASRSATAASMVGGRAKARAERERSEALAAPGDAREEAQPDPGWGAADAGWQAAEALVEPDQQAQETTSAGLPKRVPKSNLVPGSAASQTPASSAKPATPRSADAVRGRMSSFQTGIRRGRHAKAEPVSTEQSRSNPSRHEEQE